MVPTRYLLALTLGLAACGSPTEPTPEPPALVVESAQITPSRFLNDTIAAQAVVVIRNDGGAGVYGLRSVADSARTRPCFLTPFNAGTAALGPIARGERRTVQAVTSCAERLDYLVIYGGTGENLNKMPPLACYPIKARPCPALSAFVQP